MAKGSKFVQEAHEKHIKNLNCDLIYEIDSQTGKLKRYFCDLSNYQDRIEKKNLSSNKLFSSYRYSPSKINIALGWISCLLGGILFIVHIASIFCEKWCCIGCIAIVALPIVLAMFFCFKNAIKGENTTSKSQNEGGG